MPDDPVLREIKKQTRMMAEKEAARAASAATRDTALHWRSA